MIIQLGFAAFCGIVIGLERKFRHKSAGLKTNMLICVGSCMYTCLALGFHGTDPLRLIGQIVTGVGFIGAGCVFHSRDNHVSGLTTAALIWVVAALGILCGVGMGTTAAGLSLLGVAALTIVTFLEHKMFPEKPSVASGLTATPVELENQSASPAQKDPHGEV